ncbi:hypothetical protein BH24CHL7_BH24CHL7_01000 [soil metagenome]
MRPIRTLLSVVLSAALAAGITYVVAIRPRVKAWGVDPREADLPMPGDDLIADPSATETRGIAIAAPPATVWPWLIQMGYERAGWYSYDAMDNKGRSAQTILPEHQHLAVGEVMPTHPGGGFRVEGVEPERALVLYTDTALVREQAEAAQIEGRAELPTPGLKASGAMTGASFPDFAASWAFLLEPSRPRAARPG